MYKVFIENKPILFQFNSQLNDEVKKQIVWCRIDLFLKSNKKELIIELKDENDFNSLFSDYKKIEAAGGLIQKNNACLFIKRNGFWDIPKGKLEGNESPESGAIREVEEECGVVSPIIVKHLINTWHTYVLNEEKILKKTWWYIMKEGAEINSLVPQVEEGITEVRFIDFDEFNLVKSNTFGSILDVISAFEDFLSKDLLL